MMTVDDDLELPWPAEIVRPVFDALTAPRPHPRKPMLSFLRLLGTNFGHAERCPQAACRRSKCCLAGDLSKGEPACAGQWTEQQLDQIQAGWNGMLFLYHLDEMSRARQRALFPAPSEPEPEEEPKPKRRGRQRQKLGEPGWS